MFSRHSQVDHADERENMFDFDLNASQQKALRYYEPMSEIQRQFN